MVFVVLSATKNLEVLSPGEEHGADKDSQDDLGFVLAFGQLQLALSTYQRLTPWRKMEHRFTVPCRRDLSDCQVLRHDLRILSPRKICYILLFLHMDLRLVTITRPMFAVRARR